MNGRWQQIRDRATVLFCKKTKYSQDQSFASNQTSLSLLSKLTNFNIFDYIPRTFSVSTKNFTSNFNIDMLTETSSVISDFLKENPKETHFFLNINDEENVLSKFERLFQGETVFFDEDEVPTSQRITKVLQIKNCPNYLKPKSLQLTEDVDSNGNLVHSNRIGNGVIIYQKCFINYLKQEKFQTFKIKTKKNEYKCNIFSVKASKVIKDEIEKNKETLEFVYDIEDEYDEFQSFCDIFNFNNVYITSSNMDSLKEIAEDLQIDCIIKQIDNYINNYEKFSQKIDEKQTLIDSIDNLFDLLYNIDKYGIEKVKMSLLQSKWSTDEESVQELAAFIIQVIKPSFALHKEIAELLIQLNNEANESNKLDVLVPFIINKLMLIYMPKLWTLKQTLYPKYGANKYSGIKKRVSIVREKINLNNRCVYSFIRVLYKKGMISKEEIMNKLKYYDCQNKSLNIFFLPEIIEINPRNIDLLTCRDDTNGYGYHQKHQSDNNLAKFISKYYPDKIDQYDKMLDNMEPEDELTKSILHDDVDTLQKIITINELDISNFDIPYNVFDDYIDPVNILNYSALCGSLKCFKYLLLNNGKIDKTTLYFAVYGSNTEIIKIVDQRNSDDDDDENKKNSKYNSNANYNVEFWFDNNINYDKSNIQYHKIVSNKSITCLNYSNENNIIASTIALHRNELFDWIFEKKFVNKRKVCDNLKRIAYLSASSGNAHSLIEIIDNGFDISESQNIIYCAAENGFCELTKLLMSIIDGKKQNMPNYPFFLGSTDLFYTKSVIFGNVSIFKLLIKQMDQNTLENAISYAIDMDYKKIVSYFFDNLDEIEFSINIGFINVVLNKSFRKNTDEWFNFLFEKFNKTNPKMFTLSLYIKLLNFACYHSNLAATKILTDLILKEDPKNDFSNAFIQASSSGSKNICHYFIDKKVCINFEKLSYEVTELGSVDEEIFAKIFNNVNQGIKQKFLMCIDQAITNKNIKLIEFLLKEKAPMNYSLFEAVNTHDLEIVNIILKYNSKPSFINKKKPEGTALHCAIINKDLDIVKRLLSIPGINPSIVNQRNENALISAINIQDITTVETVLDFYGDDIAQQNFLVVYSALNYTLKNCFKNNNSNKIQWKIILLLLSLKGIDPNFCEQNAFLYRACIENDFDTVKDLLKLDKIDVNKYETCSYNTPLMAAIINKNVEIVKLLINHPQIDINLRNIYDESALMIAIKNNNHEIVDLIIHSESFDPIESRLTLAFAYANLEVSKQLMSLDYLDVNKIYEMNSSNRYISNNIKSKILGISPLNISVGLNNIEKMDMIINHPSFDKYKSDVNEAIFTAARTNNINAFKKLIKLIDNDVNITNPKGENLLFVAAKYLSGEIIDEIFNTPQFDLRNNQICESIANLLSISRNQNDYDEDRNTFYYPNNWYPNNNQLNILNRQIIPIKSNIIDIIEKIYNYDQEHEKLIDFNILLPNGKSYLTCISNNIDDIDEVIEFLLDHGADPNMKDNNGDFPLQIAIETNSNEFVSALINYGNINYELKNYLHLAAAKSNQKILELLLEKNVIDINSTDSDGSTPLIIACTFHMMKNIGLLFKDDNLDYLHCNNKGEDALDTIKKLPLIEHEAAKQSKKAYYDKIISIILEDENNIEYDDVE